MSDEGKKISATFFVTEQGNEPVREWLKEELTAEQRKVVGTDMKTIEFGWPMGMPTVRKLEAELWEVRTRFREGIARVMFSVDDGKWCFFMVSSRSRRRQDQKTLRQPERGLRSTRPKKERNNEKQTSRQQPRRLS